MWNVMKEWEGEWETICDIFKRLFHIHKLKNEIGNKELISIYFQFVGGNFSLKYILKFWKVWLCHSINKILLMLKLTSWFHSVFREIITTDLLHPLNDVPNLILHLNHKLAFYGLLITNHLEDLAVG